MTRAVKEATSRFPLSWRLIRSCWQRFRCQPGATWRKHYWISTLGPELSGKQLELLKEIIPKLSRVAVLGTSSEPGQPKVLKEIELAAEVFKVHLQPLDVLSSQGY